MKQEIHWITIWLLLTTSMGFLSLSYVVLSNEIDQFGINIVSIYLLSSILPFIICKYKDLHSVQKQSLFLNQIDEFTV